MKQDVSDSKQSLARVHYYQYLCAGKLKTHSAIITS
jgi:hypothetical protein